MLFNSHIFLLVFLPITLIGYFMLGRLPAKAWARNWLLAASMVFYAWWSVSYLALLVAAVIANFLMARKIHELGHRRPLPAKLLLAFAISANLGLLVYFKYSEFIVTNVPGLQGLEHLVRGVVIPLAISFHTFQQIAYLVDAFRQKIQRYTLPEYGFFVLFYPQLIAGPIVHHYELLPQVRKPGFGSLDHANLAAGFAFFVCGLLKKVALADPIGALATPVFDMASAAPPGLVEAWTAVVAFSLGLYFDFSGYSDMAVGLARMVGLRLPYNFDSPYQATSIMEFWRRWHMTLSRWLRDYLYIPLGGNRHGWARRYLNLMITMLLGGLWHGAAWTFIMWGVLHGTYLLVNHAWSDLAQRVSFFGKPLVLGRRSAQALTLLAVMVGWVFFRAGSFEAAVSMLAGMVGAHGLINTATVAATTAPALGITAQSAKFGPVLALAFGMILVLWAPNSQAMIDGAPDKRAAPRRYRWVPNLASAAAVAAGLVFALAQMADIKEFVYFQF